MRMPPARAVTVIAAATALAWAVTAAARLDDQVTVLAGFIPARFSTDLLVPNAVPALLTPLTATLVHGGLLHLAFNLLMIIFCGRFVEASLGTGGLILLYVVGAYAACAGAYLVAPDSPVPLIGASGAGSAIIGAYAMLYGHRRMKPLGPIPGIVLHVAWLAAAWVGIQLLIALSSGGLLGSTAGVMLSAAAHIGGFLAGLALARPLLLYKYRSA